MVNTLKAVAVAATLCVTLHGNSVQAANYTLDPSHTSIIFGINHLGYSFTYGRFSKVSGAFVWDDANPAGGQFQIVIDASSIDSNDTSRDEHLRGPDFFNANQFPTIAFQSTSITPMPNKPGSFNLSGNLTIHGVTRQVTIPLKKLGEGNGPFGNYRSGFICQTSVRRSDYGMTTMLPNIGDDVAITISFEGIRQAAAAGSGNKAASPAADPGNNSGGQGSGSSSR